jgi:DNA-binding response OmpR family regulator
MHAPAVAGATALVVDADPRTRGEVAEALRALGVHVVAAHAPIDAVALLDGIDADVVVVRARGAPDVAVAVLRSRACVVELGAVASADDAVLAVVAAIGDGACSTAN